MTETATAVRERPILFSGPMVRAILEGRKTQTRLVVKPQPTRKAFGVPTDPDDWVWSHRGAPHWSTVSNRPNGPEGYASECPFGQPGDRLWVRETWTLLRRDHWSDPAKPRDWLCPWMKYGPTRNACSYRACCIDEDSERCREELGYSWRPSIHMPRWASRLTLEITDVRVERLQDITEEDAIAEGAQCAGVPASLTNRGAFAKLWEHTNGNGAWSVNPWVWVVKFRKLPSC